MSIIKRQAEILSLLNLIKILIKFVSNTKSPNSDFKIIQSSGKKRRSQKTKTEREKKKERKKKEGKRKKKERKKKVREYRNVCYRPIM